MSAGNHNITLERTSQFLLSFQLTESGVPVSFVGYEAEMSIKTNYNDTEAWPGFDTLTVASDNITLDPTSGWVDIQVPTSVVEALPQKLKSGKWTFNLVLPSGEKVRQMQGDVLVSGGTL